MDPGPSIAPGQEAQPRHRLAPPRGWRARRARMWTRTATTALTRV